MSPASPQLPRAIATAKSSLQPQEMPRGPSALKAREVYKQENVTETQVPFLSLGSGQLVGTIVHCS